MSDNIEQLMQEVAVLNAVDHPNIVNHIEDYVDQRFVYMGKYKAFEIVVMEYIDGVSLVDKICEKQNNSFDETQAALYMHELFSAITHCHTYGIIHRDIKPENIMVTKSNHIKLIDFGLCKVRVGKSAVENEIVGTGYYMAPEVISDGKSDEKIDIWSLGVVLYLLVSGYLPFQGRTSNDVFAKILRGEYHFDHPEFKSVTSQCKDLIKRLLVVDPEHRISGREAL
jgi:calcium-dependent protein kinase